MQLPSDCFLDLKYPYISKASEVIGLTGLNF